MATSGSTNYSITLTEIITEATQIVGVADPGDTLPGEEYVAAARTANVMVKSWMNKGLDMLARRTVTLFLVSGTESYTLASSHATESYVETEMRVAGIATDTTLEVDSTTGMTAADNIGIKLDDGTIHWTTISSITDTDTLVIATALPSAAAVDNEIYTYTTKADKPQRIMDSCYRRDTSGLDTPVGLIGLKEYSKLSDKDSSGPVNQIYYDMQGTLYVWPATDTDTVKLVLTYEDIIEDFDSASDNPNFPSEWYEALCWGLADKLAYKYGLPVQERRDIAARAEMMLRDCLDYDQENASVVFELGRMQ